MANLITEKQKKKIRWEYLIRLHSVSLFIISLLGTFFLAYVIPYYISVSKKDITVAEQFSSVISIENKENIGESVTKVVNQTLDEIKVVESYSEENFIPSNYFERIIISKNSNIKITKLSFGLLTKNQGQLVVGGISRNRDGLVNFIDNLKSQDDFVSVESPVSDFAKDKDISFTLNIKIAI